MDNYMLSDFIKDPAKDYSLDREITESSKLMSRPAKVTKERHWIGGNHEDRLRKTLWANPKFANLKALQFESLFHLDDHGFQWHDYGDTLNLGRLIITHGDTVAKHSGWTARAHFDKFASSVLIGHTHRLGAYYVTQCPGHPR